MQASTNKLAAYGLAKFINTDPASSLMLANQQFLFPTTKATLADPAFTDSEVRRSTAAQQVNKFFAGVSDTVDKNFQWLPIMDFVNSSFTDTLGKAVSTKGNMRAALTQWQSQVVAYAKQQGFTVK